MHKSRKMRSMLEKRKIEIPASSTKWPGCDKCIGDAGRLEIVSPK